ncbi:MAG: hypothetical protein ACE5EX_04880 [Phycisphaerae bacterium]
MTFQHQLMIVSHGISEIGCQMNPNIVIIGVPRSGTSILASMIQTLGWHYAPDANWGGESAAVMAVQRKMIDRERHTFSTDRFDAVAARTALAPLTAPWVLKDTSLSFTLHVWAPLLHTASGDRPLVLMCSTRDTAQVERSWRRRTGLPSGGTYIRDDGTVATQRSDITLPEWCARAVETYDRWSGVKVRIDLADMHKAAALVDTSPFRAAMRRLRLWRGFRSQRARVRRKTDHPPAS